MFFLPKKKGIKNQQNLKTQPLAKNIIKIFLILIEVEKKKIHQILKLKLMQMLIKKKIRN